MKKALDILKHLTTFCGVALHNECMEAIEELEALESRSCEGCKYYVSPLCPVEEFSTPSAEFEKYPFYCNRWEAKQ